MSALPVSRVVRGDVRRVLWALPSASMDLVVADPGYGRGKGHWDVVPDYDAAWISEVRRVLKVGGSAYIFGPPATIAAHWAVFPEPKRLLTWYVTNRVVPRCRDWQPTSEGIAMFWRGEAPFFDRDAARVPYTAGFQRQRGRPRPPTPGRFGSRATRYTEAVGALPRDILVGPGLSGKVGARESLGHPCQKPLWLMQTLIKASCPAGGLVLDLYAGVATTSAAAHGLGRQWISVENDPNWCEVAVKRLRDLGAEAEVAELPGPEVLVDLMAWKSGVERELSDLRSEVAKLRTGGSI